MIVASCHQDRFSLGTARWSNTARCHICHRQFIAFDLTTAGSGLLVWQLFRSSFNSFSRYQFCFSDDRVDQTTLDIASAYRCNFWRLVLDIFKANNQ